MKTAVFFIPLALAGSAALAAPGADEVAREDERAAKLACDLGGVCGDLARTEANRSKANIDGVDPRMITIGQVNAAKAKRAASARPTTRLATPSANTRRRQIEGRRPATALGGTAANVPSELARQSPLFVTFELGSARLTPSSMSEVRSFTKALSILAASGQTKRFRIEGHTDSRGDEAANRALSERRAAAVRDALIAAGADGARIEVSGVGEAQPP